MTMLFVYINNLQSMELFTDILTSCPSNIKADINILML